MQQSTQPKENTSMQMKRFMNKKVAAIGLAAGLALGGAGAAFAYFTAQGNGSGTGLTGNATAWSVNSPSPSGGPLYPDQGAETFAFVVTNSSNGSQGLNTVKATVAPHNANCDASWYDVSIDGGTAAATTQAETYLSPVNIQKGDSQDVSVVLTLVNTPAVDQSACEGDTPVVTLAAS
jgi:type II secretory pathway pseudopilin PulG